MSQIQLTHPCSEQVVIGDRPKWQLQQKCRNRYTVEAANHAAMSVSTGTIPVRCDTSTKLVDCAKRHHSQSPLTVQENWRPSLHLSPKPVVPDPKLYGRGRVARDLSGGPKDDAIMRMGRRPRGEIPKSEKESDHVTFLPFLPRLV